MANYIALMRKSAESDYSVDFPDFPGCITAGKDLDEARRFAEEALTGHIELLVEEGEIVPEPSSLETIMADPENRAAVVMVVTVPPIKGKTVRVNVTIDEATMNVIDRYVTNHGTNRSAFLADAALKVIRSEKPIG